MCTRQQPSAPNKRSQAVFHWCFEALTEQGRSQLQDLSQGKLGWWTLAWLKLLVACLMDQPSQSLMPVRFRSWWKYMQAP